MRSRGHRRWHRRSALRVAVAPLAGDSRRTGDSRPPPTAGMVIKGKAPVSNDVLKVKLPKPQEADLANGLHLMVLEDHRLPRVVVPDHHSRRRRLLRSRRR